MWAANPRGDLNLSAGLSKRRGFGEENWNIPIVHLVLTAKRSELCMFSKETDRSLLNVICKQSLYHQCFRWIISIFKYPMCKRKASIITFVSGHVTSPWWIYHKRIIQEVCFSHFSELETHKRESDNPCSRTRLDCRLLYKS